MSQGTAHVVVALCVAIVFSVSLLSCFPERKPDIPRKSHKFPDSPPTLRVCVLEAAEKCEVRCDGPVAVLNGAAVLANWNRLPKLTVYPATSGIAVGSRQFEAAEIDLEPLGEPLMEVNGKQYRGAIRIARRTGERKLDAINLVNIESYLLGVVGCEMSSRWPAAALEAQAIAARSYALRQWRRRRKRRFDLRATQSDQVYGGTSRESRKVTNAVERTRGVVLLYGELPLMAYYSACCGGHTAGAVIAMGERTMDIPPLRGGPCNFCNPAMHVAGTATPKSLYHWRLTVPKSELAAGLRELEYVVDAVTSARGLEIDASGRSARIEIGLKTGRPITMTSRDFRRMVGYRKVKSTKLTFSSSEDAIEIEGYGWGHGVGLCQWGAKGMADAGQDWKSILQHYYPQAEILPLWKDRPAD